VENPQYTSRYSNPAYYEVAERFAAHARERGVRPATLAVAWVMFSPGDHGAAHRGAKPGAAGRLPGGRRREDDAEWRAAISALSAAPAPAHGPERDRQ